jgi:dCTP deaminase
MAFWSGEKLSERLPELIAPYRRNNIDCASYLLCVGNEVFATSDKFATSGPAEPLVTILDENSPKNILRIKPGQFAFLITQEEVKVPSDAIALISMRAGYKLKGLINVSGFHVDPGWSGKLLFSVYNAGPQEVIVSRGEAMFLIVYSDLDRVTSENYDGKSQNQKSINISLLQNMTEQVFSPLMLKRKIDSIEKIVEELGQKISEKSSEMTSVASQFKAAATTFATVFGLVFALGAILVTFFPSAMGVVLAKTIEGAGYELKQKEDRGQSDAQQANTKKPVQNSSGLSVNADKKAAKQ